MKKIILFFGLVFLMSCGSSEEKKKGFEYNRTQKEEKKFNSTGGSSVPVDMDNKGIGPIKSVDFGRSVDNSMAEQGKTIFNQKCTACHMAERKLIGPAMKVVDELTGIPSFETPDYSEVLSEEKAMIEKLKKVFLMVAGAAVQKYGPDLEEHQQLLMAASNILIEIYMAESAILRTEKNAKRFGLDSQKHQIEMSQLYLYNAVDIILKSAKEGIVSFAEGDEQRMMLMGLKRFTKYQNHPNVVALRKSIAEKIKNENKYPF